MITFAGLVIPGIHKPVVPDPPEFEGQRTKYYGLRGESEIVGKPGGRKIKIEIQLYAEQWTNERDLFDYIKQLDDAIGTNDQLIETGTCTGEWEDVTFEAFVAGPEGRLPDVAKTLSANFDTVAWFCKGVLHFYQNTCNPG